MIKCEALEEFSLRRFNELKNVTRNDSTKNEKGMIYKGDIFECEKDIADYLNGNNNYKKSFIKVIEVIPQLQQPIQEKVVIKEKPKRAKKNKI